MKTGYILLSGLLSLSLPNLAGAGVNDGLIGYFPFNGDTQDESGKRNHGIANGELSYVKGVVGQGVQLKGVLSQGGLDNPDFIKVSKSPLLSFKNAATFSYFVKIDSNKSGSNEDRSIIDGIYGTVMAKQGDRKGFYFTESETKSEIGINIFNGGGKLVTDSLPSVRANFRHVVYTVNRNAIKVYIDGELVSSGVGSVDFTQSNKQDLYIGVQNNSNNLKPEYWYPLAGTIDELRIYNRTLPQGEITQLYNAGKINLANSNTLFDFAEQSFPQYFSPAGQPTRYTTSGYTFRYYSGTENYVGTNGSDVYIMGKAFEKIQRVGKLSDFIRIN